MMSAPHSPQRLSPSLWRIWAPPDIELSNSELEILYDENGDPQPVQHTHGLRTDKITLTTIGEAERDAALTVPGIRTVGITRKFLHVSLKEAHQSARPAPIDEVLEALAGVAV